jgi:hypothetical protein
MELRLHNSANGLRYRSVFDWGEVQNFNRPDLARSGESSKKIEKLQTHLKNKIKKILDFIENFQTIKIKLNCTKKDYS